MFRLLTSRRMSGERLVWTGPAVEAGLAAYARGAAERDCPYDDDERSAAWAQGFRCGDRLDAAVW